MILEPSSVKSPSKSDVPDADHRSRVNGMLGMSIV